MLKIVSVLVCVAIAASQHHHHGGFDPHFGTDPHHGGDLNHGGERPEMNAVNFFYDPDTHYMVSRTQTTCYFMALDTSGQTKVHTGEGMEQLELSMMSMINGGEDQLTNDQIAQHSHMIDSMCHNHKLYMVGAKLTQPSVASPEQ